MRCNNAEDGADGHDLDEWVEMRHDRSTTKDKGKDKDENVSRTKLHSALCAS